MMKGKVMQISLESMSWCFTIRNKKNGPTNVLALKF